MNGFIQRKRVRLIALYGVIGFAALALTVIGINGWVTRSAAASVFTEEALLPSRDVGLVLGTRRYLQSGRENLHFRARVDAAAVLYHSGKVKHLLLSGDNSMKSYDEPADMREALLDLNVPDLAMTCDSAGFRTLDSVVRARQVFSQSSVILITDDFHAARAVFLAERSGLDSVAFCSDRVPAALSARSRIREVAARVKAVLDLYVLRTEPHFLGEPVDIQVTGIPTLEPER